MDITWAGSEYTQLTASTKVGDDVGFEVQTYPWDTGGNGAELQLDWDYTGTWSMDSYYGMTDNGTQGNNRKWWRTVRMLHAGDHARKYKAFSPDYWVPGFDTVYAFTVLDLDGATACRAEDGFGPEMLRVHWTKPNDYDVMVVRRAGAAPDAPTPETVYAAGDTYGPDGRNRVVYAAGGGSSVTDYGLAAETDYHYAFFSVNNDCYSTVQGTAAEGQAKNALTGAFHPGLLAGDSFAYAPDASLNARAGGRGWSGPWSTAAFETRADSFANQDGFPVNYGNKIMVRPANDAVETSVRAFSEVTGGRLYAAGFMNYQYDGPGKFAGFSLMDGATEKAFFGEISAADQRLGLSTYDEAGSSVTSDYVLEPGTGKDYLVIGMYDFGTRELRAIAYAANAEVPAAEPAEWSASVTLAEGRITRVNALRIGAGEVDEHTSGTPGDCYFDEIRLASTWADLVGRLAENPRRRQPPIVFLGM